MKKTGRLISLFLVLTVALSLGGCNYIDGIVKQVQAYTKTITTSRISGIYTDSASGECLAFDTDLPDIAFSGNFNQVTGKFTATEIYACRMTDSTIELYKAAPPHFAADFLHCSYQLELGEDRLHVSGESDMFIKWVGEYRISYNDSLAQFNDDLSFEIRSRFFSDAFAEREKPAPQTKFVPESMEEDVGNPIENTVVKVENYYARSTLAENERAFYDAAYDAVYQMKDDINVKKYDIKVERVSDIIRFMFADAPELFWSSADQYTYTYKKNTIQTIQFEYNYSEEDVKTLQTEIDAQAADIVKSVDATMSEYQKFIKIYTELGNRIEYDWASYEAISEGKSRVGNDDQTIVGGLYKYTAVCGGISRSLQYMLHAVGIECYWVTGIKYSETGSIPPGNHGWNMIKIEGQWYYADLTEDLQTVKSQTAIDYLMTDKECALLRTFTMQGTDGTLFENPPLPECDSERFDLYVRNPTYFDTFDEDAVERLKSLLFKALQEGKGYFKVFFENTQDAAKASEMLTDHGNSIAGDIPAFNGIAVFQIFPVVTDSGNIVIILPGYRIVPATSAAQSTDPNGRAIG